MVIAVLFLSVSSLPPVFFDWLRAFLLTLAIELPIVLSLFVYFSRQDWKRVLLALLAGNCLTHPLLWIVVLSAGNVFGAQSGLAFFTLLAMEVFAVLAETVVYYLLLEKKVKLAECFAFTLAANLASYLIGTFLF